MSEEIVVTTSVPEPDFSVCGRPVIELVGCDHLDEHVESAAMSAIENPSIGIAVCLFAGETCLGDFERWVRRQRQHLAAWRATQPDRSGKLKLRTQRIVRPGENISTVAFVVLTPVRVRAAVTR
jgi:hypothetical protein